MGRCLSCAHAVHSVFELCIAIDVVHANKGPKVARTHNFGGMCAGTGDVNLHKLHPS